MVNAKFLKSYKTLCVFVLALIALGGSVRAMNAGLACPDWPLCFGDFIPDYHPQVYFEFLHRVLAGLVAIAIVVMNTVLIRNKSVHRSTKVLCWFTFVLLFAQVIMGGLTVLKLLQAFIVTGHLALGTGLFAVTCWIYQSIKPEEKKISGHIGEAMFNSQYTSMTIRENLPGWVKPFAIFLCAIAYAQILLGGLVASHYAALSCTEFPTCVGGVMVPTWSGPIGLHVIHRFGAYFVFSMVLLFWILAWFRLENKIIRDSANTLLALLFVQIGLGIANVLFFTPPLITVLHLTFGALILATAARLIFQVRLAPVSVRTEKWIAAHAEK